MLKTFLKYYYYTDIGSVQLYLVPRHFFVTREKSCGNEVNEPPSEIGHGRGKNVPLDSGARLNFCVKGNNRAPKTGKNLVVRAEPDEAF